MIIKNCKLFIEGEFREGNIEFGQTIEKIGLDLDESKEAVLDACGAYLIPGLIDVHTHGAMNHDASDGDLDGLKTMGSYYAENGVTSWCPTTMTLKEHELKKAVEAIRDYEDLRSKDSLLSSKVVGIHMEGPFVSKEKCGAQNPDNLADPDVDFFNRLQEASGNLIKLITLAPELPGSMNFIKEVGHNVAISIGHTMADYETAMAAFDAGANHATHLYNAMPALGHRAPGVIGAAFDSGAFVELITDGFHIDPSVIRMTAKTFGNRLVLISDSLRCAGMPDGEYELGGQMITMADGKAYMSGTTTIAGSSISLMEGMRRAISYGVPLEDAITAATITPAKSIGVENKIGSIAIGKAADLVLLDKELNVVQVFIDGEPISHP